MSRSEMLLAGPMAVVWEKGRCFVANAHGHRLAEVSLSGYVDAEGRVRVPAEYAGDRDLIAQAIVEALNDG